MTFFVPMLYQLFLHSVTKNVRRKQLWKICHGFRGFVCASLVPHTWAEPHNNGDMWGLYSPLDKQETESSQEPRARYKIDKWATICLFQCSPAHLLKLPKSRAGDQASKSRACGGNFITDITDGHLRFCPFKPMTRCYETIFIVLGYLEPLTIFEAHRSVVSSTLFAIQPSPSSIQKLPLPKLKLFAH